MLVVVFDDDLIGYTFPNQNAVEFESFVRIWNSRNIGSLIRRSGAGWLNSAFVKIGKLLVEVVRSQILLSH